MLWFGLQVLNNIVDGVTGTTESDFEEIRHLRRRECVCVLNIQRHTQRAT